jgi:hypothetical protein
MKMRTLIALIALSSAGPAIAVAGCYEPSPPSRYSKPTKPEPPRKPFCAGGYTGKNTCNEWEVSSYNSSVRSYNSDMETYQRDVEDYVRKLKQYLEDAQSYAVCEVKSLEY